jgi:hypothetical protein
MIRTRLFLVWALAFFSIGCIHPKIGPNSVPRDRSLYSGSIADSWKDQMLLNIVKIRYVDSPVFVDVSSIVASYTLAQNYSAGGLIVPDGASNVPLSASVALSHSPTITYTPLTGNAYIKGLITPLPLQMIFGAIQNGMPADAVFLSSVVSINGLKNEQAGIDGITPADPGFHRVRELLRKIQISGLVRMYVKEEPGKRQLSILTFPSKGIPPDILAASKELRGLLHLDPDATEFTLVSAGAQSSDTEVAVLTRAVVGILMNMAAQVEVPPEHMAKHLAFRGFESARDSSSGAPIIRIHSSESKPDDSFVTVYYRKTWFWIDDGDLNSKRAFMQLMQLFTMTDTGVKESTPVVTIPSR